MQYGVSVQDIKNRVPAWQRIEDYRLSWRLTGEEMAEKIQEGWTSAEYWRTLNRGHVEPVKTARVFEILGFPFFKPDEVARGLVVPQLKEWLREEGATPIEAFCAATGIRHPELILEWGKRIEHFMERKSANIFYTLAILNGIKRPAPAWTEVLTQKEYADILSQILQGEKWEQSTK